MNFTTVGVNVKLLPQRGDFLCWAEVACAVAGLLLNDSFGLCDLGDALPVGCDQHACAAFVPGGGGVCDNVGYPDAALKRLGVEAGVIKGDFASIVKALSMGHPCVISTEEHGKKVNHVMVFVGFVDTDLGGVRFQGLELVDSGSGGRRALYLERELPSLTKSWTIFEAGLQGVSTSNLVKDLTAWCTDSFEDGKEEIGLSEACEVVQGKVKQLVESIGVASDGVIARGELQLMIARFPTTSGLEASAVGVRTFLSRGAETYAAVDLFWNGESLEVGRVLVGPWLERPIKKINLLVVSEGLVPARIIEWEDLGLEVVIASDNSVEEPENPRVEPVGPRDYGLERPWAGERRLQTLIRELENRVEKTREPG